MTATIYPPAERFTPRGQLDFVSQHYLTGDESLRVQIYCINGPQQVTLTGRQWSEAEKQIKPFVKTYRVPSLTGIALEDTFSLEAGALLNVRLSMVNSATLRYGQVFGRVTLLQGKTGATIPLATLLQGYFTEHIEINWPGSDLRGMHEAPGLITDLAWSTAVAPVRCEALTGNKVRTRLISGAATFQASAVVAPRLLRLSVFSNGAYMYVSRTLGPFAASTGCLAVFGAGLNAEPVDDNARALFDVPLDLEIPELSTVQIFVINGQAGDFFTPEQLNVRQWMEQ